MKEQKIIPFIWFENQAEEAAGFYVSLFDHASVGRVVHYDEVSAKASGKSAGSVMTVGFELEGMAFTALNGGPVFRINPSVSFYIYGRDKAEIRKFWSALSDGGRVMMELAKYPFNELYGWVEDRFGLSWQLILSDNAQKIAPCLMFVGPQQNRAEEAMNYYMSVFPGSRLLMNEHYKPGEAEVKATVIHGEFLLAGQKFIAMDSAVPMEGVQFNEAVSMVVNCKDQEEIDHYWARLGEGGDRAAQQCGWLKDRFGFSWQVVPESLPTLLNRADPEKARRAMAAMLGMKKIDIAVLESAAGIV